MTIEFRESRSLLKAYTECRLCPRRCGTDRSSGGGGFCGETGELRIAAASIHRGEEPPVTGLGGSGTIFITGCTLGCLFCQNWQISQGGMGKAVAPEEFSRICMALQERGAENINIVTGSHGTPAIISGIRLARSRGLKVPVLWNSSAYEGMEALSLLKDTVDIYLPDLKTLDSDMAGRFFRAPDYPKQAEAAILRMMELRGRLCWEYRAAPAGGETPVLVSGVMIRHLVLPDHPASTRKVLQWFAEHGRGRALLSLMTQYTPVDRNRTGEDPARPPGADRPPEKNLPPGEAIPQKQVGPREYDRVLRWLEEFDIEEGFCQELVPGDEWLPDFRRTNPFSSELSTPIWHWKTGFV
ncbi:MAG: radical SAM protein [Treponema sp.]|jgi:putative pyruvate formate lyase activating enzyme|nr:radical SAM protein [Treponema sp.]